MISVPAAVLARIALAALADLPHLHADADPPSWKSARMPSSMICFSIFTMWAWRILRRFTTSVICMRVRSSFMLRLNGEDADLAGFQVVQHRMRHVVQADARHSSSSIEGVECDAAQRSSSAASAGGDFLAGPSVITSPSPPAGCAGKRARRCARPGLSSGSKGVAAQFFFHCDSAHFRCLSRVVRARFGFRNNVIDHFRHIASLVEDAQLAVGAGSMFEYLGGCS